jgi:hypothetical protein
VSLAWEARNVADYCHYLRCQDWADTEDFGERGAGSLHLNSDALVEFRYAPIESAHVSDQLGGQLSAEPARWMLGPGAAQQFGGATCRELLLDRLAEEVSQQDVEAVEGAGALADQVLAPLGEQPQDFGVAFRTVLRLDRAQPIVSQSGEGGEGGIQCIVLSGVLPVESTLTREESLGATSTTLSPAEPRVSGPRVARCH